MSIRILLLEDNEGDVLLVNEFLKRGFSNNYSIEVAQSLSEALALLKKKSQFDIILADMNVPDSSQLATLSALQGQANEIPIIILTGHADDEMAIQAIRKGAQDYLVKDRIGVNSLHRILNYAIVRRTVARMRAENEALESVKKLAGSIAHEFSQPLQILSQVMELIADSENVGDNVDIGKNSISRIAELVRQLRSIVTLETESYLFDEILDLEASSCPKETSHSVDSPV